jgi:predicted metal-binding membrane protein
MAGLVGAGGMGLIWVLTIAAMVAAEKLLRRGEWVARGTGAAFLLLGAAVALWPDLVTALRGGHAT